ncbi:MAG: hypothetical protein DHS20C20_04340 [Ardenticatenaceae bacterium]|nr:MAG: hypothetical protein DHS20C20_04340 [Ardenticatenaceae bacterium]
MLQLQRKKSHKRHFRLTYALIAIGLIILLPSFVYAASVTKSNANDGAADGNEITRTVELTTSDFATGSTISTVTTTVEFAKIDAVDAGSCFTTGHQGGDPINREIYMYLTSPTGTRVDLIFNAPNFTYTDNSIYGGTATVVFDDAAATLVGGPAPSSGTFRPEEALNAFFGEDPLGTWTLTVGDSLQSAPVCFYDFSLTVTAEQAPVVEDQTFSVAENSPNDTVVDTIVANDSDPDDKLSFTVTGGTGQNVFDVDVLTGEITVADDTQLTTTGSFTLNVTVADSAALSDTAVITINVTNQNDAPVITQGTSIGVTMDEDGAPTPFNLTLNATDEEADGLTWTIETQASNGTATTTAGVGNSNAIGYAPTLNFNGTDLFVVEVSDGNGGTDEITVNVTINPQNDDPNAVNDSFTVDEDSSNNTLTVLDNDTNPDSGETLSVSAIGATSNGGVTSNNTTNISYSPAPGYVGTETFSYTLSDGNGRTDTATVTITVNDVNEDPIIDQASPQSISVDEDGTLAPLLNLTASDGDGDSLTWSISDQGNMGTASFSGGSTGTSVNVDYAPTANMNGSDSFEVQVSDGRSGTDTITVNVTINEQNDDPSAVDDSPSVNEQSTNNNLYPLVNDSISPDIGETLTITAVGPTDNGGMVSINGGTSLIYSPDVSFIGTETFTYTISDGRTGTDTATIRVSVDDVNFSPVITEGTATSVTMDEDGSPTAFSLTLNATDADADTMTWNIQSQAMNGTATVSGTGTSKTVSYTPTANYNGSDSFMVRVTDGNGGLDAITVNVTIDPINDDPVATDDSDSTPKDTAVTIDVLDNDTDPEDDSLSITAVTQGSKGSVSHNGSTVTYTPNPGEIGTDTFTYTISDGTTGSDTGTVTVQLGVFELFIPMIANNFVSAPDLVVTSINASSDLIEVVIENQGTQATSSGFWVDFYIAPDPAPTHANELWSDVSSEGIVWGVDVTIPAGGSLTLSYSTTPGALNLYYSEANSSYGGNLPDGTSVYAQVDSAHLATSYGGVLEIHEILSETYNNVSAEYIVGTFFSIENDLPEATFVGQPLALPPR